MKKDKKLFIIIGVCAIIAAVALILFCTRKKSYESLIKGVNFGDTQDYFQYTDKDISTDSKTGESYINNKIYIVFDEECSEEKMANVINSIHGKVVGGDLENKALYIQVKKSTLENLKKMRDKLNDIEGVEAFINFYVSDEMMDEDEYFEEEWEEDYDDEIIEE